MSFTYFRVVSNWGDVGSYSTEAIAREMKERYLSTKPTYGNLDRSDNPVLEDDVKIFTCSLHVDSNMFPEVGADPEYKRMRQAKVDDEIEKLEAEMAKRAQQLKVLRETKF